MLGDGGNWIHRIFIFTLYSPFTCFKTSRQILSFWIFFSLSVCVCACSQSSVCARVPAQAKVATRSALGSLSFWMPRAHTETDTRHNGTRVALSFSFMTKQIWLVNVIILVAILSEGEKQTTIIFARIANTLSAVSQFHIPAHTGNMKAKNRDQSLSDSRELDGSYDQLTGEWASVTPVVAEWFASGQYFVEKTRTSGAFEMLQPVRRSPDCSKKKKCFKKLLIYVFCLLGEKKETF